MLIVFSAILTFILIIGLFRASAGVSGCFALFLRLLTVAMRSCPCFLGSAKVATLLSSTLRRSCPASIPRTGTSSHP